MSVCAFPFTRVEGLRKGHTLTLSAATNNAPSNCDLLKRQTKMLDEINFAIFEGLSRTVMTVVSVFIFTLDTALDVVKIEGDMSMMSNKFLTSASLQ